MATKTTKAAKATGTKNATIKGSKPKAKAKASQKPNQTPQKGNGTNPFRVGGGYWASVEAMRALGMGKMHAFDAIVLAVIRAMGAEAYKAFKAKDSRNEETGKDANARIIQNVGVVARKDYGKPLRDLGYEVRFDGREKIAGLFKTGK